MIIVFSSCNLKTFNSKINLNDLKGFKCYESTKIQTPIRLTQSGDIECFSLDGKDCSAGFAQDYECRSYVSAHIRKVIPVRCTKEQYTQHDHWCNSGKKYFFKKWHCPSETGLNVAIKFNKKTWKVQCLSLDGKKCLKGKEASNMCMKTEGCKETLRNIIPKSCSKNKNTFAGDNWCKSGYAYFLHSGKFICENKTGIDIAIRLSRKGNIQCLSNDGETCLKGLTDIEMCTKAYFKETEGGLKKARNISCGKELKDKTGESGFSTEDNWCFKGYKYLYKRDKNTSQLKEQKVVYRVAKNFKPKWFRSLVTFIKKPDAKTRRGQKKIKKILKNHGFGVPEGQTLQSMQDTTKYDQDDKTLREYEDSLREIEERLRILLLLISSWDESQDNSRQEMEKISKYIKKNTPSLTFAAPVLNISKIPVPKLKLPRWFNKLKISLRKPTSKTPKGLNRIRNVLIRNKYKITPKKWKAIEKSIVSGKIKSVVKNIKKNTPSIRKLILSHKKKKLHFKVRNSKKKINLPSWYKKIIKSLRKPSAKSPDGLKKIKKVLTINNYKFTPKKWKNLKKLIQTGKIKSVIKKIKINTPTLRKLFKNNKKTKGEKNDPKWFIQFKKSIKHPKARTIKGLKIIRIVLRKKGFEFTPRRWNHIKRQIKSGYVQHTPKAFRKIINLIKKHTPKLGGRKKKSYKGRDISILVDLKKKCRKKVYEKLKRMIRKPESFTSNGLKRIKRFLNKNFVINKSTWRKIKKSIKRRTLRI